LIWFLPRLLFAMCFKFYIKARIEIKFKLDMLPYPFLIDIDYRICQYNANAVCDANLIA
jgi:hypothetical protein